MIKISVIVPCFNSEQYIGECIESLLSQTYPRGNYEIIIVDNNSTDSSPEIVKKYSEVKLLTEERKGSYAARNRGLKEAGGRIIAFTDSDCAPETDWLECISKVMESSNSGIVVGRNRPDQESFLLSLLESYENEKNKYVFSSGIKELYYGQTNNMAVRKELSDEIGPFVERDRGSDSIFVSQCVEKYSCDVVRYCDDMRVRHLEIDGIRKKYHKYYIYGGSRRRYRHIANIRPLSNSERLRLLRGTVKNNGYNITEFASLLSLLTIGYLYWVFGAVSASWNSRKTDK